ncbi:hypothetical protein PACILC2_20780 [Paenibacillus cisolokensis]|uniref:Alcohol dehydrogenase n=1 Tax=Paenibacillus cisolokensis TaxID=1658519 RepID=A0ABQ4N5L5_9BACL|nr:hypothetical protein PACILC2_20780 [Paenibacillus cisolokensis]
MRDRFFIREPPFTRWRNPGNARDARFSAEHGIAPKIEVIRADQVDEAYERVLRSDVRYRFVIDMATL